MALRSWAGKRPRRARVSGSVVVETRDSKLTSAALHSVFLLLAGGFVALAVFERYQPLDAPAQIRALALALPALFLILILTVRQLIRGVEFRAPRFWLLAPAAIPWIFALALFSNGWLDRSPPERQATVVVGKYARAARGPLFHYELVVRSWRAPGHVEGIILRREDEFNRFRLGDPATVLVRRGFLRLAWIDGVEALHTE